MDLLGMQFSPAYVVPHIDITTRSQSSLKEAYLALEGAARRMRLRMNQEKTRHIITIQNAKQSENITW
jgi:hypothetical protein